MIVIIAMVAFNSASGTSAAMLVSKDGSGCDGDRALGTMQDARRGAGAAALASADDRDRPGMRGETDDDRSTCGLYI